MNLEKDIVLRNVYLLWLKNKELLYIRIELAQRFWQIYLKLMIAYYIIYYLLNYYFHIVQLCGCFTWNLINRLHGRALRVIYRDFNSSFGELLRRDSSTTLHQRYLQNLMTEIFKIKIGIAPERLKGFLNLLMHLIIWGINLNLTIVYPALKGMELKRHLLEVQNYGTKFPHQ